MVLGMIEKESGVDENALTLDSIDGLEKKQIDRIEKKKSKIASETRAGRDFRLRRGRGQRPVASMTDHRAA